MTGDLTAPCPEHRIPEHSPVLSIIVPMLNEAGSLPDLLAHLTRVREQIGSHRCDVLLVDGGSRDDSVAIATQAGFRVVPSARGRARQMNTGAQHTQGHLLLFLHADTRLPEQPHQVIEPLLQHHLSPLWGRFDVTISGDALMLTVIATLINLRSRLSGIATGDQAMFVSRTLFDHVGQFPDQPLMEDIELSKRLKRQQRPHCLRAQVHTSGRRWLQHGVWRTIFLMWRLRWAYWRGAPAEQLAKEYNKT
ncbi:MULTISPECIES: TIGR04283 family arsenosugar biosynthesis glycosyltransferase [unclassified Oceanobacter]|uniref:TIGR04283 family arsenosugar biosynthesis glycosyltransferase n=1 Tax=unclassified Oceanobacter TaxID=2620260 RepID=UPI0026E3F8A9|nr:MULTISPECIES: TIGR04283 family arsenosugar biosynthesis glycosyltransferase [unclassified Oceanobacter]MDO6680887.1 TIGR04283 family arsenosugar biosynthesis glycosyltransferase [Oceanobacter sp. 5_MG-2023]MDP2504648.1 TIGR04283 family arsenosugar biosynthesis glycosyltransferase [Oceanobacter sp. 3_MG-2023]